MCMRSVREKIAKENGRIGQMQPCKEAMVAIIPR